MVTTNEEAFDSLRLRLGLEASLGFTLEGKTLVHSLVVYNTGRYTTFGPV